MSQLKTHGRNYWSVWLAVVALGWLAEPVRAGQAADLQALYREGQTFLTWQEDGTVSGEWYCVYVSAQPITAQNLDQARRVAKIPEGSRHFQFLRNVNVQAQEFWTNLVQEP